MMPRYRRLLRQRKLVCLLQRLIIAAGVILLATNQRWEAVEESSYHAVTRSTAFTSNPTVSSGAIDNHRNHHLPSFSLAYQENRSSSLPPHIHRNATKLLYVHVGKTGGITLDKVLRSNCMWYYGKASRRKCLQALQEQGSESKLSQQTMATLHFGPRRDYNNWISNATFFLITLRNPIARAVSAYNFDHPGNGDRYAGRDLPEDVRLFYIHCFPTLRALAKSLRRGSFNSGSLCWNLATGALRGTTNSTAVPHLRMNYKYYHDLSTGLYPKRPILSLRTEFLWNDLRRTDVLLGGDGVFSAAGLKYTHGSPGFQISSELSPDEKRTLCCYMAPELELYQNLLQRSINLFDPEKTEAIIYTYEDCGRGEESLNLSWHEWVERVC